MNDNFGESFSVMPAMSLLHLALFSSFTLIWIWFLSVLPCSTDVWLFAKHCWLFSFSFGRSTWAGKLVLGGTGSGAVRADAECLHPLSTSSQQQFLRQAAHETDWATHTKRGARWRTLCPEGRERFPSASAHGILRHPGKVNCSLSPLPLYSWPPPSPPAPV